MKGYFYAIFLSFIRFLWFSLDFFHFYAEFLLVLMQVFVIFC